MNKEKGSEPILKFPAVVLDLSSNGIGIIRSLKRKGIEVFAYDTLANYKKGKTRYAKCESCPHPVYQETELLDHLISLAKGFNIKPVLFAGSDDYVFFISKYRHLLSNYFLFLLPEHSLIESVMDKRLTYKLALEFNIPTPKTFFIDHSIQLENILEEFSFPCILKPVFSSDYRKRMNKKAIIVESPAELMELYPYYRQFGELMIQEYIPGEDHCVYELATLFNNKMDLIGLFTSQKLHQYPPDFGSGTLVLSERNTELINSGVSFLQSLNLVGLAHAEFKLDSRDKKLKFIEINARTTVSNSLSEASGINFPYLYYLFLIGQNPSKMLYQREGIKWIHFIRDFLRFLQKRKNRDLTFYKWIKSLSGIKAYAAFSWDDPMPFIRGVISDVGNWCRTRR